MLLYFICAVYWYVYTAFVLVCCFPNQGQCGWAAQTVNPSHFNKYETVYQLMESQFQIENVVFSSPVVTFDSGGPVGLIVMTEKLLKREWW